MTLLAWLASRPADVIALQEVEWPAGPSGCAAGDDGYPYRLIGRGSVRLPDGWLTRESIVVLSRFPIVEHRFLRPRTNRLAGGAGPPGDAGRQPAVAGRRPSAVAAATPKICRSATPSSTGWPRRSPALDGPVIVAGDFNASPYTPAFRGFVEAAGLATFRSFPATYSQRFGRFGIPIDHVLVRGGAAGRSAGAPTRSAPTTARSLPPSSFRRRSTNDRPNRSQRPAAVRPAPPAGGTPRSSRPSTRGSA